MGLIGDRTRASFRFIKMGTFFTGGTVLLGR